MRTTVTGKQGPDLLIGSVDGSTFIYNTDGNWLAGSQLRISGDPGHPGPDTHFSIAGMEASADIFQGDPASFDVLRMGDGQKVLFLDSSAPAAAPGPRLVNIDEIIGGSGGQVIDLTTPNFTYGNVTILGGSGNDVLASNAGNDFVKGGLGNDYVWGGSGNDTLWGGERADKILGADGNDKLAGQNGDDRLQGGAGDDTLSGGAGADGLNGGEGNDILVGSLGADTMFGAGGNDTLYGGSGSDFYYGGLGADTYVSVPGQAANVFGLVREPGVVDTVIGFDVLHGDKLQFQLTNFGLAVPGATSTIAGDHTVIGSGSGIAMAQYSATANANGTFDLNSISLNADAVVLASGPVTATTATAAHQQFVYSEVSGVGTLYFDADGSGAGAAEAIMSFTAPILSGNHELQASDFLLLAR